MEEVEEAEQDFPGEENPESPGQKTVNLDRILASIGALASSLTLLQVQADNYPSPSPPPVRLDVQPHSGDSLLRLA